MIGNYNYGTGRRKSAVVLIINFTYLASKIAR
jgi:hypothetical protein